MEGQFGLLFNQCCDKAPAEDSRNTEQEGGDSLLLCPNPVIKSVKWFPPLELIAVFFFLQKAAHGGNGVAG